MWISWIGKRNEIRTPASRNTVNGDISPFESGRESGKKLGSYLEISIRCPGLLFWLHGGVCQKDVWECSKSEDVVVVVG